jgi:predicted ATPase
VSRPLPAGTVTFLFTDVEGSTRLLHELGEENYANALAEHRRIVREQIAANGGVEVDTQGDAFFVAFATAPSAVKAATSMSEALARGPIRVRVGIHTGTPLLTEEGYVGHDVHRAARIAAAGHGGQVLVSSSTASLLGADGLRDLGEHRLKDLSAPERIYQVGAEDFPPLKSLHQTNLPVPATPFLGREKELGEVLGLLTREDVRLLTLTGPGGTGKTRLGAQAAGALADAYPNGVWWIPLAPLRDPALVVETAAQTLGAHDGLAEHIGDKSMLLLFDNFEQVIDAAGDVADLLSSCPNLDVLVTSRESLHVAGEQEYAVQPLVHEEGVGFFLARARAVDAGFDVDDAVSDICRRLDDLPLALELAAARVKALSSEQILERLEQRLPLLTRGARDLPERQRTLRATIEWSYELLTADEKQLFSRLAVFRGGCTIDALENITDTDVDTLQSLVDKSLARHTRNRYWMLETIREYAVVRLEDSADADALRDRHAQYFLALAEKAEPYVVAARPDRIDQLEQEHDNLRAALDRFEELSDTDAALRLCGTLARFWLMRGHLKEGSRRLESALKLDGGTASARAKALTGSAGLLSNLTLGDESREKTLARAEEAVCANRAVGETSGLAEAELVLGTILAGKDMERARELWETSLHRFRTLGDEHHALIVRRHLAWAYDNLGDRERCIELNEENLRSAREIGNERIEGITLGVLATIRIEEGRVDEAVALLKESHRLHVEAGDPMQSAFDVFRFSAAAAAKGKADVAATVLSASDALTGELGLKLSAWDPSYFEYVLALICDRIDAATFDAAWERGRTLTAEEAVALARDAIDDA